MILVTTEQVPGQRETASFRLVRGSCVRARHIGKDILANFRNITGGEVHEYTKLLGESREQAIDRMIEEAEALGANAVIGIRFQTSMVMQGSAEMLCYGTAVKLEAAF